MNILVLGSGGREHAMTWALAKSSQVEGLYVAPGNGGTARIAQNVTGLDINDAQSVLAFCQKPEHAIDLVVIGPEAPLVAGVADDLRAAGILVFGPDSYGAQLEGSKTFSKEFMDANNIPTARYGSFDNEADALAAGKGVIVAEELEDALEAVHDCFSGAFGAAGAKVVIEECLVGPECSLLAFVSNGKAFCMTTAQDHKRAYDGDRGPNTGGMGVYSPVPILNEGELPEMQRIMQVAAQATARDPFPVDYRGVLYGGFMLTEDGPKVLAFNARFGDPETQVILPRLENDFAQVVRAIAEGSTDDLKLSWRDEWAVCVVLASEGYPGAYEKGKVILGIDEAEDIEDVTVFHAGTALNTDGELITAGGRVLNVVALGKTFEEARDKAYEAVDLINFEGKQYRQDIGKRALIGRSAW